MPPRNKRRRAIGRVIPRKQFYAIIRGYKTGIFKTFDWAFVKPLVEGYHGKTASGVQTGAKYRGFVTLREAADYWRNNNEGVKKVPRVTTVVGKLSLDDNGKLQQENDVDIDDIEESEGGEPEDQGSDEDEQPRELDEGESYEEGTDMGSDLGPAVAVPSATSPMSEIKSEAPAGANASASGGPPAAAMRAACG